LDWWIDLVGSLEEPSAYFELANTSDATDKPDAVKRNLNNWKNGALPHTTKIDEYFSDQLEFKYNNVFLVDDSADNEAQFGHLLDPGVA